MQSVRDNLGRDLFPEGATLSFASLGCGDLEFNGYHDHCTGSPEHYPAYILQHFRPYCWRSYWFRTFLIAFAGRPKRSITGVAILVWIIGGLIAWAGAASFAELGAAIPNNGGMLEYLSYIYGDLLAAIMSWIWIMAVKPSSMAVLSTIFAEYWTSIVVSSGSEHFWLNKLLAVATLGSMVLVNALGSKHSTRLIDLLLFIKLMTVASVVIIAILVAAFNLTADGEWSSQDWRTRNWFARREKDISESTIDWATIDSWELLGYYTNALYAGLWSYSGWDSVSSLFRLWVCLDGSKLTRSG